jgi:ABC-2 type transport system ATP-binding protein
MAKNKPTKSRLGGTTRSIEIRDLTKKYGKLSAVDHINLDVFKGEIFGVLGPNGAGKTTTLLMLATLLKPTSGTAKVNGFNILEDPTEVRESISMVFQDPSSDELLTGYENLKLHGLLYNLAGEGIERRIEKVLTLVDLTDRKNDLAKKYSGGMRRRLEIARGLLHDPQVLFLDEPTLGLDPQTREHIWSYIETLSKEMKMTILITTHYMEEAERLCNRIAIIDHGKVIALDTPKNLISRLGGDIVKLRAKKINVGKLKKFKFIKKIEKSNNTVKLTVENTSKNLQKILKEIENVDSVEVRPLTLNDVFLHYTGREIREEGGTELDQMRAFTRVRSS